MSLSFSQSIVGMANDSNNQSCMTRPTLVNLNPDKYNQGLHCYPFMVKLGLCSGSCNNLDDLFDRIGVPNKTEYVNSSVFNMTTRINESKTLKNIYHAKVNVNLIVEHVIQIKSEITINFNVNLYQHAKHQFISSLHFGDTFNYKVP